jgi:hypothetical protein
MSANRSVQAAQRRRAGPTDAGVGVPRKSPQPSINSSQMFAGQTPGRSQQQQQVPIQQKQEQPEKLSTVSKMTIPQAITLITLRLGAVESKLLNMPEMHSINSNSTDNSSDNNSENMKTIMLRLESLEKRSGTGITPELNLLKQQFEVIKQSVVQTKGSSATLIKENVSLKTQIENLRKELVETKELLSTLQNLTINNSQQILDLSKDVYPENFNGDEGIVDELTDMDYTNLDNECTNLHDENESSEIVGNNLKQIIESELNTSINI